MCEMLANQYFMMRRFPEAMEIFEKIYPKENNNLKVKAKLIICYIVNKEIDKAFEMFVDALKINPLSLFNISLKNDECPCNELITMIENDFIKYELEDEKNAALIMLLNFCDLKKFIQKIPENNFRNIKYQIPENIINEIKNFTNNSNFN